MTQSDQPPTELESFPALASRQVWQCRDQSRCFRIDYVSHEGDAHYARAQLVGDPGFGHVSWSYETTPVYTFDGVMGYTLCGIEDSHSDVLVRLLYDPTE